MIFISSEAEKRTWNKKTSLKCLLVYRKILISDFSSGRYGRTDGHTKSIIEFFVRNKIRMREWERKIYEEKIDGKKEKKGNQVKSGMKRREIKRQIT